MSRRLASEFAATAFLVAVVIGSGIAGDRLSDSVGLALLINAFATGAGLIALILAFGPASGAHMNPIVSMIEAWLDGMSWRQCAGYVSAQLSGGLLGAVVANTMYGEPALALSDTERGGAGLLLGEAVAAFGLVTVILGCARSRRPATAVAFAVGAYIASAYFFTASTSFANPAVTFARMFTDTFSGIRPGSSLGFFPAQIVGALAAAAFMRFLYPDAADATDRIVTPHHSYRGELG